MTSVGDWGEIIDEAEAERFVGREQELDIFLQQIGLNKPRYLIFYITGQGGAGKTTLLNRYREIAVGGFNFLVADCDERQRDVPAVLGRFAHQLAEQGFPLEHFGKRYKTYRQKMHEIENDPEAPKGLAGMLARTVVRAAFIGGDLVPGVRKGLELVPREAAETQASEWATYLTKKLTDKDEIALIREPVSVLPPLFFEDLNEIAQKRKVLLCFENFEATRPELQEWLLRLREYKPSSNMRIAIAGRDQPGGEWDPLRNVTQIIRIDVFTEKDAEEFLNAYNIIDIKRRKEILELSGRLPVLMSWLAAVEGNETETAIPTHDIVERFLRWVTEPSMREVALLAAIPRTFNADILKLLLEKRDPKVDEQVAFDWLQTMPFVKQGSEGWYYHDVVRRMILQYQRLKSPQPYRQVHATLAHHYDSLRHELGLSDNAQWANELWRKETLAYVYHCLVADPTKHWAEVISLFAIALRKLQTFAVDIIDLLNLNDVQDELSHEQNTILQIVSQQLRPTNIDLKDRLTMFDNLYGIADLSPQAKGYVLSSRAVLELLNGKSKQALRDIEDALHYIPEDALTIADRGLIELMIGQFQKAVADFNRAIALGEKNAWVIILRGMTYRQMGRYQEALADFDRAIAPDERDTLVITFRGTTYLLLQCYQEALADFNRAIALDEKNILAIAMRSILYILKERYQEALADLDRAIALDEKEAFAIINQNLTDIQVKRPQESLKELSRILKNLDEISETEQSKMASAIFDKFITRLGEIYTSKGDKQGALAMFDQAIALNEQNVLAFISRGIINLQMKRYQEALADFDRAIALDEQNDWVFAQRGNVYYEIGHYQEALADYNHAIALNDRNAEVIDRRGDAYRNMGRYQEALADYSRAITLDKNPVFIIDQGLALSQLGQYAKAVESYKQVLKKNPSSYRALYNLAVAIARWKGISDAQIYILKARVEINKNKTDAYTLYGLGGLAALTGKIDEALDFLQQAIQSKKQMADAARHDIAWLDLRADPRFQAIISDGE